MAEAHVGLSNDAESSPSPVATIFCRRCQQNLAGIGPQESGERKCPECARPFDPADTSSYAARPRSRLEVFVFRRLAPALMLILLCFTLLWNAWIPRPIALFGRLGASHPQVRDPGRSTLWIWAGSLYGPTTIWTGHSNAEAWVWNNRVRRVQKFDHSTGELAWEVLWQPDQVAEGGGIWTVRVLRPIPQDFDLIGGFRATRDRLLGVLLGQHDASLEILPFEVRGSEADVLSAYIRATGITVRPIKNEDDQRLFWIFDEQQGRLVQVEREELARLGIEFEDRTGWGRFGLFGAPGSVGP